MIDETYRQFWERFLGRYPDFQPTKEQTEDWRRELRNKDPHILEAAVSTVVAEKSSQQPRLPWFINAYYQIRRDRAEKKHQEKPQDWHIPEEDVKAIEIERKETLRKLQDTHIDDLRTATMAVLKKYGSVLDKPKDGKVEGWSTWLRAAVCIELYGDSDVPI
jgi:hypothetical protein